MATLVVLLAFVGLSCAAYPNGVLYPFDIESLLVCQVENPLAGEEDQPNFIPEPVPRLPFEDIVNQRDHPDVIWLPGNSGFRIPPGFPDTDSLIDFLGDDYNTVLTSPSFPVREAPRGCELVPAADGSAGDSKIHISVARDPTPVLDLGFDGTGFDQNDYVMRIIRDPSKKFESVEAFEISNLRNTRVVLLEETNTEQELCDIHTGLCPLNTTWAELPNGFFPKFFAQGTCSNKNCSFPRGKFCEEDFTYTAYVTVLRWDCCFDKLDAQIQWACGWRKVQIPMVCDCQCACSEVFP